MKASQDKQLFKTVVDANTAFAFKLFSKAAKSVFNQNLLISPLNTSMGLQLLLNGASGKTLDELHEVLALQSTDISQINRVNGYLVKLLKSKGEDDPIIERGTAVCVREGILLSENFIDRMKKFYQARSFEFDILSDDSIACINKWAEEQTHGKIRQILDKDRIDPETRFTILNTLYFKALWRDPFDKRQTREKKFWVSSDCNKPHPMMALSGKHLPYYRGKDFQAVRLFYRGAIAFSMDIFLPDAREGLDHFLSHLNIQNWSSWNKKFRSEKCDVSMPKFKLRCSIRLGNLLESLGMKNAFAKDGADFANLCRSPTQLWLSDIWQKTYIEVDELGTEAAAVDVMDLILDEIKQVNLNHPFFYVIRHEKSSIILFMGIVADPTETEVHLIGEIPDDKIAAMMEAFQEEDAKWPP